MFLSPPDLISRQSRTGHSDRGRVVVSQTRLCPRQSRCVPGSFVSQTVPLCPKPVRVPDSPAVSQGLSCPRKSRGVPGSFVSQTIPWCPKPFRVPDCPDRVPVSPAMSQACSCPVHSRCVLVPNKPYGFCGRKATLNRIHRGRRREYDLTVSRFCSSQRSRIPKVTDLFFPKGLPMLGRVLLAACNPTDRSQPPREDMQKVNAR